MLETDCLGAEEAQEIRKKLRKTHANHAGFGDSFMRIFSQELLMLPRRAPNDVKKSYRGFV